MPQMNEKNWMIIVAVVIVLIGSLIYNIISARNLKKKKTTVCRKYPIFIYAYEEYRRHQQKDI